MVVVEMVVLDRAVVISLVASAGEVCTGGRLDAGATGGICSAGAGDAG